MIASIKGKIEFKGEKFLVIEAAGIGYKVFCSPGTLKNISEGKEIKLFTGFYLKERTVELYGFLSIKELELFETLNGISGIGPKIAMMLASLGSLEKLKEIIEKGRLPQEIKGVGKKKAQKILLELIGRVKEIEKPKKITKPDEALDALISLGFSSRRAREALSEISDKTDTETKIKEAIKALAR